MLDLFGVGVEGAVGVQPLQDVRAVTLQAALQLDGVVARVEDEQGRGTAARRALQQLLCLLHRHVVGVLLRTRLASMGATQESRSKESPVTNW